MMKLGYRKPVSKRQRVSETQRDEDKLPGEQIVHIDGTVG
jgi:hypothetical protein